MSLILPRSIWEPGELLRFLATTNVIMFLTALAFFPAGVDTRLDPSVFLSPSVEVLLKMGASGTLPVFSMDRWWTVITANYLHGSLLHVVFNVMSLLSVGKITLKVYGPSRLFLVYFLGGVFAMAASSLAGIELTVGASGAICALIGAMAYDDWRANKGNLKKRLFSVGIWVFFIAVIGLILPNVNNWAHAVGFASGFLFGFCFWPNTTQKESPLFRVMAGLCMLLTIGTLVYGLMFS
jgi:rhomboid protease GluP